MDSPSGALLKDQDAVQAGDEDVLGPLGVAPTPPSDGRHKSFQGTRRPSAVVYKPYSQAGAAGRRESAPTSSLAGAVSSVPSSGGGLTPAGVKAAAAPPVAGDRPSSAGSSSTAASSVRSTSPLCFISVQLLTQLRFLAHFRIVSVLCGLHAHLNHVFECIARENGGTASEYHQRQDRGGVAVAVEVA